MGRSKHQHTYNRKNGQTQKGNCIVLNFFYEWNSINNTVAVSHIYMIFFLEFDYVILN